MAIRPSSDNVNVQVDKYLGTTYDIVKSVYDNLDSLTIIAAEGYVNIDIVAANISNINIVAVNIADVTNFADVYIGPAASDPTTRTSGDPLLAGDMYFNTTLNTLKTYDGAVWITTATIVDAIINGDVSNAPTGNAVFDAIHGDMTVTSLQLTGGTGDQGKMTWNSDEETVDLIQNGATLQFGQELQGFGRNTSGATILDGTPVMFTGSIGASGRLTIGPMTSTVQASAKFILGLATTDILNNADGKVTAFGKVRDIDTTGTLSFGGLETWNDEDVLWLDSAHDGYLTNVEPTSGMGIAIGAIVLAHATQGSIYVRITPFDRHLYATIDNPTFTGTVSGITATMVGLGNVDNTSDVNKPVSTAQQTAFDLKSNLISPTFTGTPVAPTAAAGVNSTQIATTQHVTDKIADLNLYTFKGTLDASTNPNYPAADAGYIYVISVAGKIGGASGPDVEIGDTALCILDGSLTGDHASVGANWVLGQANLSPELYALLTGADFTGNVTTTGDLAIGHGTPINPLSIFNTTTTPLIKFGISEDNYWTIGRDNTSNGRFNLFNRAVGGAVNELFTILTDGRTGVGTVDPDLLLHINELIQAADTDKDILRLSNPVTGLDTSFFVMSLESVTDTIYNNNVAHFKIKPRTGSVSTTPLTVLSLTGDGNAIVGPSITGNSRLHINQGALTITAAGLSNTPLMEIKRNDQITLFGIELSGGVNNDNLTFKNFSGNVVLSIERATDKVGIKEANPDYALDVNGSFGMSPGITTTITPVDNGDLVIETTSNTLLTFKLKGSDGTVRTGTLALA